MKRKRKLADDRQNDEFDSKTEEGLGSKSQSNDMENYPDRMEMMEDNGHEEGNIDQDEDSMETTGYVLTEGKGRNIISSSLKNDLQHMAIIIIIYNT